MAISLWSVQLERPFAEEETERLLRCLPTERRQRLMKTTDRRRWQEPLAAYGLLSLAMLWSYDLPSLPNICHTERGKPLFSERPDIHFSISHTHGAVLIGLSDAAVGVDLEKVRPVSSRVRERLAAAGESEADYFRNWVCYEAAVKRSGAGVSLHSGREQRSEAQIVDLFPGYCAAVCGAGECTVAYLGTAERLLRDLRES